MVLDLILPKKGSLENHSHIVIANIAFLITHSIIGDRPDKEVKVICLSVGIVDLAVDIVSKEEVMKVSVNVPDTVYITVF